MARTETMVQLTDELISDLDNLATRQGVSRSALIRAVLISYVAEARSADIGNQIVAGYTRIPPATPDAWGDLERLNDQGTKELLARLDAEEQGAGHEPWRAGAKSDGMSIPTPVGDRTRS